MDFSVKQKEADFECFLNFTFSALFFGPNLREMLRFEPILFYETCKTDFRRKNFSQTPANIFL